MKYRIKYKYLATGAQWQSSATFSYTDAERYRVAAIELSERDGHDIVAWLEQEPDETSTETDKNA